MGQTLVVLFPSRDNYYIGILSVAVGAAVLNLHGTSTAGIVLVH